MRSISTSIRHSNGNNMGSVPTACDDYIPLLGWGVLTVFRPYLSRKAAAIIANCTVGFSAICVALSIKTVVGNHPLNNVLYDWISIPGFSLSFGLSLDRLSLLMAAMVTGVGFGSSLLNWIHVP